MKNYTTWHELIGMHNVMPIYVNELVEVFVKLKPIN